MRSKFAIIFCVVCLSGCAGVRDHWSYAFGRLWSHTCGQIVKHGPEVATGAALDCADSAIGDAIHHGESRREREERKVDEFFDEN